MRERPKRCRRCGGEVTYNPTTAHGMSRGYYCETCGEYHGSGVPSDYVRAFLDYTGEESESRFLDSLGVSNARVLS